MPPRNKTPKTPGQLIEGLMKERGWTQKVLSAVLDIPVITVGRIVRDQRPVDAQLALALAEVFGTPAERFLELQQEYDLAKARLTSTEDPQRATRARLLGDLPVQLMMKRGWIKEFDLRDADEVSTELARFFRAATPDDIEVLPHAARRTQVSGNPSPAQLAWIYRVREIAEGMSVPAYSSDALEAALDEMRLLRISPDAARKAPRLLAEAGVRLVVVETIGDARIDGVCLWLDDRKPVIGLSMRFDRIDNFWFVLRHECEHVLRGHGRDLIMFDADLSATAGSPHIEDEEERVANIAAADFCVPSKSLRDFIARKSPVFSERDLLGFASTIRVHPGLVAGQLQNATGRFDRFRPHLAKIRDHVLPNVVHDGWGDIAPV